MPDGFFTVKTPSQILTKIEQWEKQHRSETNTQTLTEPERKEVTPKPEDEFKSHPEPTREDQIRYALGLQVVTQAPPEKKPEDVRHLLGTVVQKADEAAKAVTQASVTKTPEAITQAINKTAEAAKTATHVFTPVGTYKREDWEKIEKAHEDMRNALGQAGKGIVDGVKGFAEGAAAFGRGIWYGIVGPPEDEDLSDEIAALKGVGFGMMSIGAGAAGVAAATGIGAPAAALFGGISLLGWALTDNFAGRLEFIQGQRQKEKYDKQRMAELKQFYDEKREADTKAWAKVMDDYLEKKKATEAEILQMKQQFSDKKTDRETTNKKVSDELDEEQKKDPEQKREEEENDRKFYAVLNKLRAIADEIKGYQSAADTAKYNKNIDLALENLNSAYVAVQRLKDEIDNNAEILKKYGYYESLNEQARALENVILAHIKVLNGQSPTRELRNAVTNYANSTLHFNRPVRNYVKKKASFDAYIASDVDYLRSLYRIERKNYATGYLLSNFTKNTLEQIPLVAEQPSKLSPETIVKFREWLYKTYKTPLAQISNYVWNLNSGYAYTPEMLRLIYNTLQQAGVMLEEVATLTPKELEAILRARQYLYAASKRGYFLPYELELYTRLKELLMLRDVDVRNLFKLKLPKTTEVSASV
jgi:hypothetical protein